MVSVIGSGAHWLTPSSDSTLLLQLIAGVRDGRVDLSAAQNSSTTRAKELEPLTDIVIAPITIDPLTPLDGTEGVRP